MRMRHGDDNDAIVVRAIDDAVGKALQEEATVP
jgi:hypothetical protein